MPPGATRSWRRGAGLAAFGALAFVLAYPMQVNGFNQTAHYALVKALNDGVPYIDDTIGEVGDLASGDVARFEGHLYTVKAPGLAFAAQPAYAFVEAVGMRTTGDPTRAIWVLNVATSALATFVLLLLVRRAAERFAPGRGTASAVILGLGALTLPFATLFFSHALGAALAFAAFAALLRERDGPPSAALTALAGFLAGLAIVVEHPVGLVAVVLAAYVASRGPRARRLAAYVAGGAAGIVPLLAFNLWAFGSVTHTPYQDYWTATPGEAEASLVAPSWHQLSQMLFSSMGLLVLAPVVAAAALGLVLLFREGRRAEALVCGAVPVAFVVYFSGLGAFGGLGPPRYLTPIMPFLAPGLAVALRSFPLTTLGLAAVGCFQAVVMTATGPLAAYDGDWLGRVTDKAFVATAASLVEVTGWYTILPYFLAALVALAGAAVSLPRLEPARWEPLVAVGALAGWGLLALLADNPSGNEASLRYVAAAVAGAAVVVAAVALAARATIQPVTPSPSRKSTAEQTGQV
jgi:hypothetical protein